MPTTPPSITALPTPPDPNDRATFNTRAYPWSVAQQTLATEANAVASNVYANASEAASSANSAAISVLDAIAQVTLANAAASSAEATAGATQWVSGTTYAVGDVVWSPINQQTYRRKVAGAGTTDPSADNANWTQVGGSSKILRSTRTSNAQLTTADNGKLIDITGGTFAQTFAAAATLGDGWFCYLRNSGTGDITLDPDAAEQIDGLTSYIMYPGEVRLVQCDGSALRSVVLNSFRKVFTASGNFIKPPGYSQFAVNLWGGGASGRVGATNSLRGGGGGGGCAVANINAVSLASTTAFTIGAGGARIVSSTEVNGNNGGDSSFHSLFAYGGIGGTGTSDSLNGAGGAAFYKIYRASNSSDYSATGGAYYFQPSLYGGASGLTQKTVDAVLIGSTVYGGGGGQSITSSNTLGDKGTTIYGGAGGDVSGGAGTDGTAPGGGGGASSTGNSSGSGAGARGELRIWGVI